MYAPNSSILHDKEKTGRILGTRHHYLVNVSGLPFSKQIEFQKKKRIFWQPDFFKYLHFKYQQFLWKYQILPALIWTALVSLRSKRAPGQNGAFCNCFSSCKRAQTLNFKFEMFIFHSKYFVYRKLKSALQKVSFCFKWPDTDTGRILGNIP